jgi:Chitin binding Peritrophin-A domain
LYRGCIYSSKLKFSNICCCSSGSSLVNAGDINLGVSDFKCPPGYVIYPHPQQCELYYTCYNTEPTYLWQCRSNLLFDLVYDGCNWPEQTYCGNRTRPDRSTGITHFLSVIMRKSIISILDGLFPSFRTQNQQRKSSLYPRKPPLNLGLLVLSQSHAPMMDFIQPLPIAVIQFSTHASMAIHFLL